MNTDSRRRPKKFLALIICLNLVVLLAVGGTLAYIFTSSDPVTNTFTPVTADINIDETFDGSVKENVKVTNNGDVDVYVRAKVVINWLDKDNNILSTQPTGASYQIDWAYDGVTIDGSSASGEELSTEKANNWVEYGGFYYYTLPVAPGASTDNLIDKVVVTYPNETTYKLHVEILSQAVQAVPETAVQELWKVVIEEGSVTAVPVTN